MSTGQAATAEKPKLAATARTDASVQEGASDTEVDEIAVSTTHEWVGTQACRECHADRHDSFLHSHHSRSLSVIDPATEAINQQIEHSTSHRQYEVTLRGDEVWHVESLLQSTDTEEDSPPLVLSEFPIRYVIGSGKFAKGYLVQDGDYLLQSPLTWYTDAQEYGMSPGYDTPMHGSFSRSITDQCLFCHAGQVARTPSQNPHHFKIHEIAIGCERCHGPGSKHVEHYQTLADQNLPATTASADAMLIQPGKLPRLEAESLCAQCHRQGAAPISVPGKQDWDFRPGQDFATIKFNYDLVKTDPPENGFVGHFAQLGESQCYQQSEMTCISCHSPHQNATGETAQQLYRDQCNACHGGDDESCAMDLSLRLEQAKNQCVTCHMPKRDSKVPHTSTTDHRIAVHRDPVVKPRQIDSPVVYPLQDVPKTMTPQVANRVRALGLFGLYRMNVGNPHMDGLFNSANQTLLDIANSGRGDEDVFAAMATLTHMRLQGAPRGTPMADQQWEYAMRCAQEAIRFNATNTGQPKPTEAVGDAMEIAGRYFVQIGQHRLAAEVFSNLTTIRRRKYDWATLGLSLGKIGDSQGAEKALRQAINIDGGDPDLYEILAIVLKRTQPAEARRLNGIAAQLRNAEGSQ